MSFPIKNEIENVLIVFLKCVIITQVLLEEISETESNSQLKNSLIDEAEAPLSDRTHLLKLQLPNAN